ncbi:potassium-transporting ATPase subunit KdpC [Paracoccus suum]|uniref:Potassium-transporting ATPase KdpC subunit n=2 Tax=Paracoccus suum TaxID=2259340 RepID=A0A344PPL7_9RHOB|nr:potassium-transporting ATPase subunit KdpC [Paracoccus suum]
MLLSQLRPALTLLCGFALLLGVAYPLLMTGIAQVIFAGQANGSLLRQGDVIVGSSLIGQNFTAPGYLHARPSVTDPAYNAASSGASNLGPSSASLLASVRERAAAFGSAPVPSEMATASASGLDPHITAEAAIRQVPRIAEARGLTPEVVTNAIGSATSGPAFGFVGHSIVNVLKANLALDALNG